MRRCLSRHSRTVCREDVARQRVVEFPRDLDRALRPVLYVLGGTRAEVRPRSARTVVLRCAHEQGDTGTVCPMGEVALPSRTGDSRCAL